MKVFANELIFDSAADYIIGGFRTDKTSDFTFRDFKTNLYDRIEDLVKNYIDTASNVNREWGFDEDKALTDIGLVLKDNLDIYIPYTQQSFIVDAIFEHPKTEKWLMGINKKIKDNLTVDKTFENEFSKLSKKEQAEVEEFTDATFEEFIEKIRSIEL